MKIKLSMILDQLKAYRYEYVEGDAGDQLGFSSVRLLKPSEQGYKKEVLYLGSAAVMQQIDSRHLPSQLICLADSSLQFENNKVHNIDLVLIHSDCDIEVLLEKIADIISEYHQIYTEMIRRITDNRGLAEIINAMTPILGNPLYVADADFKVLARTDCVLEQPDQWRHIVENGIEDGYISSSVNDFYYMKDALQI